MVEFFGFPHIPLHAAVESMGTLCALTIAALIFILRTSGQLPQRYIWLATGFVAMGILDGFHAVTEPGKLFVFFHSLATCVGGVGFVGAALPERLSARREFFLLPIFSLAAMLALGIAALSQPSWVPAMVADGKFTNAAVVLNLLGGSGFLVAAWSLLRQERQTDNRDRNYAKVFITQSVLFGISGLLFTVSALWDFSWWTWHFIRLLAYLIAVVYFFVLFVGYKDSAERSVSLLDATVNQRTSELRMRNEELNKINHRLDETRHQLLQSEKLASIGQLAAGVAHEINNPIGYVHSNIGSLEKYIQEILQMLEAYEAAEPSIADPEQRNRLQAVRCQIDLGFLKEDITALIGESKEGIARVKKIVQDLKDFSRVDTNQEWQWANLHKGIDSTINIVANEIKYKADLVREYGQLPEVECLPSQLNQVFMNLLVNAAHAMGEQRGCITIRTGAEGDRVWLEFSDTGSGIPEEIRAKIFDPFFTTKPVGKGTGLGLSLAYGIIKKHNGSIDVASEAGKGTTFRITIPVKHINSE